MTQTGGKKRNSFNKQNKNRIKCNQLNRTGSNYFID